IVKQTPIDQATRDREMRAELAEKRAAAKDGLALYLCGVKALECNLQDLAREWFYEAAMADADVRHTAREFLASNLFSQAVFARNLKKLPEANRKFNELREKYPDCAATKMIDQTLKEADAMAAAAAKRKEEAKRLAKMKQKEAAAARAEARRKRREANKDLADIEDEIENAANAGGASDTAKADGLAAKADKLMKEAGSGGSRDERNRNFKEAMAGFKEAAVEYQKALNKKFDANLDRKLSEVQQKIYWCRKMQTL
ncbi:MAG: hypothetical protein J6333_03670, partial [Planctomycetes bacterium]|nr:hypothetical protein [Planctomycetota bacterium]